MNINEIKEMIKGPDYDFLRNDPNVSGRIILLTLGGSHAYGTNIDTSDIDVRGCALNKPSDLIGFSSFEQLVDKPTDTTIYSFNKLVTLLLNCNPNTIEMLGCKPEQYFFITDIGQQLIDNRKLFLSKRAISSFSGYATSQLRRLENALARDRMSQARREEHIRNSMENAVNAFEEKYTGFKLGSIILYTDKAVTSDELESEIFANIDLKNVPARQFNSMMNDLKNVLDSYNKLNARNNKKDDEHLNKHAMHLIRLYLMCLDILEKEEIVTYREKEHDMLMDIRRGKYQNEDGTYKPEFFKIVTEYEDKVKYARINTSLPDQPDMKKVEEFVMDINRRIIKEEI